MVYAARFTGRHAFVSMQNHYNLVYREEERETIPFCAAEGIAVIPWSPLARGFLAGDRTPATPEPTARAQTDDYTRKLYGTPDDFEVAAAVRRVAEARGVKPIQVALAWILQAPGVTAPIVGTTRLEHLKDLVDGMELVLTPAEIAAVEAPYRPHPVLGHLPPAAR
jgi:aryl-alcohol dehydrogenase (NADP+)